jgi:hypothetical protein
VIHLRCPKCKRIMSLDDSKAGKVGRCLQCNQKFRVPSDLSRYQQGTAELDSRTGRAPNAPAPAAERRPSTPAKRPEPPPPAADEDEMSQSGYGLEEIESPPPAAKKRRHDDDEEVDREEGGQPEEEIQGEEDRPLRRKRRKKRGKPGVGPELKDILSGLGIAAVVCLLLVTLSFWIHEATYALLIIGAITTFIGRRMFLYLAFEEGIGVWLACLFVPFYSTWFFFTRINETYKAFLVGVSGYLFLISGGILWFFFFFIGRLPNQNVAIENAAPSSSVLTLQLDGQAVRVPIDGLNYNVVKRGRDKSPDYFEFEGKGVNIFGQCPLGFNQEWRTLVDKPLTITPQDPAK